MTSARSRARAWWLALALLLGACVEERTRAVPAPVYAGDIETLLRQRCAACHARPDAGGGLPLEQYLDVFACTRDEDAGVSRAAPGESLVRALARADHASLLTPSEAARLRAWVDAGVPLRAAGVHAAGILNPRSDDWHGRLAAHDRFGPILDPHHVEVCGRCHAGAPVTPDHVRSSAPGAPACTSCHDHDGGVLACGTCHGDGAERAYPPRDACLFPNARPDAHALHVTSTRLWSAPLVCGTCHPGVDVRLGGTHADGHVDLQFDPARAGDSASYDEASGVCAVRCHDQGGARPRPRFQETGPLGCGDCHGAPPTDHYAGACSTCHREANADGSALQRPTLHLNGKVDLGDGSSGCGACHGRGDDPTPDTPSHALHMSSTLTAAISCGDCHVVPEHADSPGHLDRGQRTPADVVFGPRASARDRTPSYAGGRCSDIACHGAGLPDDPARTFEWDAKPAANGCNTCHAAPPPSPHPSGGTCAAGVCHGAEVSIGAPALGISPSGRVRHIDGTIEHGGG